MIKPIPCLAGRCADDTLASVIIIKVEEEFKEVDDALRDYLYTKNQIELVRKTNTSRKVEAVLEERETETRTHLAEELTDLITVCTTALERLGYDRHARTDMQHAVNLKNFKRGYIEEKYKVAFTEEELQA